MSAHIKRAVEDYPKEFWSHRVVRQTVGPAGGGAVKMQMLFDYPTYLLVFPHWGKGHRVVQRVPTRAWRASPNRRLNGWEIFRKGSEQFYGGLEPV